MMSPNAPSHPSVIPPGAVVPREALESLIEEARAHEFGLEFFLKGATETVAITFGVHAFAVDAARDLLRAPRDTR